MACYNFEKPRVRRVNRDACRRGAGAQLLKGLLEDKLRRTWAVLAPAGPPPRLAQAAPAAVAVLTAYLATTGLGLFAGVLPGKTEDPADPDNVSYRDKLFELDHTHRRG